jgi:hypothetical protein
MLFLFFVTELVAVALASSESRVWSTEQAGSGGVMPTKEQLVLRFSP